MEEKVIFIDKWEDGQWCNVDPALEGKDSGLYYRFRHAQSDKQLILKPGEDLPQNWEMMISPSN